MFVLIYAVKMIADNLKSVTQRITRACEKSGRPASAVELICVTKEAMVTQAEEVLGLGVKNLGENRVQELVSKYNAIGNRATWHLIGHLQTNKVKDAVKIVSLIHSVDSARLAKEIDKEAKKINKVQDILIQVNVSREESKFGVSPEEAINVIKDIVLYQNINIKGLMTIVPDADDPETVRPFFKALRELKNAINASKIANHELEYLSMGMSNDFEIAIEEGSSMVRIGRAIFK
jgi:PLP dependent protein